MADPVSILVVEDEPNTRLVATMFIEDMGLIVYEADDADKALNVLDEHPDISLVFTDIQMPGTMNGLSLIEQIAKKRPKTEIIVTSGKEFVSRDELPQYGTFLPKPYQPSTLKAIIEAKLIANGF